MSAEENDSDDTYWLETETPDDWVSTAHHQVYFRKTAPTAMEVSTRDLVKAGALVAKALPGDWTTIITVGPYRGHDVEYAVEDEAQRVHLDFYSVRPGFRYLNTIIKEVKQGLSGPSDDKTGMST